VRSKITAWCGVVPMSPVTPKPSVLAALPPVAGFCTSVR
jgi:hypothetical protein